MAFADWKKASKVFQMFKERAENYGIGLQECCQAAYEAGERQGRNRRRNEGREAMSDYNNDTLIEQANRIANLEAELAAAQATIAKKNEALTDVRSHVTPPGFKIAQQALAIPSDRSALDAMLAEARKEALAGTYTQGPTVFGPPLKAAERGEK